MGPFFSILLFLVPFLLQLELFCSFPIVFKKLFLLFFVVDCRSIYEILNNNLLLWGRVLGSWRIYWVRIYNRLGSGIRNFLGGKVILNQFWLLHFSHNILGYFGNQSNIEESLDIVVYSLNILHILD